MTQFRPFLRLAARCGCLAGLIALAGAARAATVPFLPAFDPARFVSGAPITNPYLPFNNGGRPTYRADGADGADDEGNPFVEIDRNSGTPAGPVIAGLQTFMVTDLAYSNDILVERTLDFYARDILGNVWYMGEDALNYVYDVAGNLIETNTKGSWRAGVNGGQPGFAMAANPTPGFTYYQEFAAAHGALDQATIIGWLGMLTVPGGTFRDVLMIFESSALGPALREVKYYATGIGLIRTDEGVNDLYGDPSLTSTLQGVAPVPLPASLPLMAGGFALLALAARRQRPDPATPRSPPPGHGVRAREGGYPPSFTIRPSTLALTFPAFAT